MSLVCTAWDRGYLTKHGISHTCLPTAVLLHWTPTSGIPRADPQVPVTDVQFLLQNFGPSSSLFQCSSLQTKASVGTGLYLINTCGYKACILCLDQQILGFETFLEDFCFWTRKMKMLEGHPEERYIKTTIFLLKYPNFYQWI